MQNTLELTKNPIASYLGKEPAAFTRADIIRYIRDKGIEMVNFMYPAADGRLKTLNFVVNDLAYLGPISPTCVPRDHTHPWRTCRRFVALPIYQCR